MNRERVAPARARKSEDAETALAEPDADLLSDIDDLLDEIDAVLEEQSVLTRFRQRSGQ